MRYLLAFVLPLLVASSVGCMHATCIPELTYPVPPPIPAKASTVLVDISDERPHGDRLGKYGGGAFTIDYVLPRERLLPWISDALACELAARGYSNTRAATAPVEGTYVTGRVCRVVYAHSPFRVIAAIALTLEVWRDGRRIHESTWERTGEPPASLMGWSTASAKGLEAALSLLLDHAVPGIVAALDEPEK